MQKTFEIYTYVGISESDIHTYVCGAYTHAYILSYTHLLYTYDKYVYMTSACVHVINIKYMHISNNTFLLDNHI